MNSIEFLQQLYPDYPWALTAIHPDTREVHTTSFDPRKDEQDACAAWLDKYSQWNLYYSVNPSRYKRVDKKLKKEDIRAVRVLHLDLDPLPDRDWKEERDRLADSLTVDRPEHVPAPTYIISSGGGYQALWVLSEDLDLGEEPDTALIHNAERYNRRLEQIFKADACHNVDRLMRLPGTTNWPDEKKRLRGRTPQPAEMVAWDETNRYPIQMFGQAVKAQSADRDETPYHEIVISGNVRKFATVNDIPGITPLLKSVLIDGEDPNNAARWKSMSEMVLWTVCEFLRLGKVTHDDIYSILTDRDFTLADHVLKQSDVDRYARRQIARGLTFVEVDNADLQDMNDKHAYVEDYGGKGVIMSSTEEGLLGIVARSDFLTQYQNQMVLDGKGKGTKRRRKGDWWLDSPNRRQYRRIVFDPADVPGPDYNLWKGLNYADEEPGTCDKFLSHLKTVLCHDDEEHFQWLLGWMAFAVQHPDCPPGSAIVLQGEEGTGKSFFAKQFGKLFGVHFKHITDTKHLTGSFNAHLHGCVLLFADEAFYAGDKSQDGKLKTLITEEFIQIERKGFDVEQAKNTVHVIMASNSDWVVPAGRTARRYFVLRVDKARANDTAYFDDVEAELENGGYAALLQLLLNFDLSTWDRYNVPVTPALRDQQRRSLDPLESWWLNRLEEGATMGVEPGWSASVDRGDLYQDYVRHCNLVGNRWPEKPSAFHFDCLRMGFEVNREAKEEGVILMVPPLDKAREMWENVRGPGGWAWSE